MTRAGAELDCYPMQPSLAINTTRDWQWGFQRAADSALAEASQANHRRFWVTCMTLSCRGSRGTAKDEG